MERPSFVTAIVSWLRAGYPEGLPVGDYLPLFALLGRRLSDEEVATVAAALLHEGDIRSETALREAIVAVTHELPGEEDVARVDDRLASVGWPGKLFDRAANKPADPADDQVEQNPEPGPE